MAMKTSGLNWSALESHEVFLFQRSEGVENLAVGAREQLLIERPEGAFDKLRTFLQGKADRAFGHLSYELKDALEDLHSQHPDRIGMPALHFFIPRFLFRIGKEGIQMDCEPVDAAAGEELLANLSGPYDKDVRIRFDATVNKQTYLEQLKRIQKHLQRGEVYELNYCIERHAQHEHFDPFTAFSKLDNVLHAPHAAFYRLGGRFALCQSPERFLQVKGEVVTSRPMKGTRPRSMDVAEDEALKEALRLDQKELSENVMAVDVVRHDLSRIAQQGSVHVPELCVVHSYEKVHQMVSTVQARIAKGRDTVDVLKAAFPMASMTGAPKIRAMQLIEELEFMRRGLFSGAMGSLSLHGHAELNVVIRTLQYNSGTGEASIISGGAITAMSDPENEFQEMELKARTLTDVLAP